jgi:integrase
MRRSDFLRGAIPVIQTKTSVELDIPIHPRLRIALEAGPNHGDYLICQRNGRPISSARLSDILFKAAKDAGLPSDCVPHGLRKAAIRRLAEHGASAKQIAAVSGHRSLREIAHYTDKADQRRLAQDAMARLQNPD